MRKLIIILVATFALYFVIASISAPYPNFDTKSYHDIGVLTLNGKSIYPDPAISRHPYLPLFLYFEAITQTVSSFFKIPQILIIKIILTFFHLSSIYTVYVLSKKKLMTVFLYAINPISLFITAFHGQFDVIPITCILFAIIALQNKQFVKTVLLLSLAITIKTWPILFIVPFLKRVPQKYYYLICLLPIFSLIVYSLLFHTHVFSMLRVLFVYQGVPGIWGFGKLLSMLSTHKLILLIYKIILVSGIFMYSFRQKKTLIAEELFELLFIFFIFTPGFGIQWFLWLTPFFFLTKKPFVYLFMTALTICLSILYFSWTPLLTLASQTSTIILLSIWPLFIIYFALFFILMKKKTV